MKIKNIVLLGMIFGLAMNIELSAKIKAIIFDCDGVLVDTEYLKFLSWKSALKKHGIDNFELQDYGPLVGHSGENILQAIAQNRNINLPASVLVDRNAQYHEFQTKGKVPAIIAAVDFANKLAAQKKELGIKIGLASSAPTAEILENLRQVGLEHVFDVIVSGHDNLTEYVDAQGKNKPKPYIYQKTAKLLEVMPHECVVFEDTNAGIVAGSDAGMFVIAVPNTYTKTQDFSRASLMLNSCAELAPQTFLQDISRRLKID